MDDAKVQDARLQDREVLELAEKLYKKYEVLTAGMLQRDYKIGYMRARTAVDAVKAKHAEKK
jgi:hypothetical protein